jgi:ubiquinone/menaquinone biosynthesis C-methylase UbiE
MNPEQKLQLEFNQWANDGRGEEMERHHLPITQPVLELMELRPSHRVLDLGCGAGWATRLLASRVPQGVVVGVDISDAMVRQAQQASASFSNITYVAASAEKIPWPSEFFDRVLSVESFYYYPDQHAALRELFRVMAPGARLFILINLYRENPYSLRWADALKVPVHALSQDAYLAMLRQHGFASSEARRIPDPSPTPENYSGKWFRNSEELRDFKRIGALLLIAGKPTSTPAGRPSA